MSALDPRPADATNARRDGSDEVAGNQGDVTEWRAFHAELLGLASDDRREWPRRARRASLWMVAGAISLLANAEVFMLLAHWNAGETNVGPAEPDVVMIDLPAVETAPSPPAQTARPDATPPVPAEAAHETPKETASREPEGPEPPKAVTPADVTPTDVAPPDVTPPAAAAPVDVPAVAVTPEPWSAAPLPVPRPRGRRRPDAARAAAAPPSPKRVVKAAAAQPAHGGSPRREARQAAPSAFAGAASAADWKSQVVAALNRAKRYPDGTEAAGSPTIRMMVAASGDVARVAIVASSGSSVLDSAAVETVRRTSPLPPPPGGATGLTFRMNFHLRSP